ncbi:MAG: O-antigen ligase family protein [Clostridium sp.]
MVEKCKRSSYIQKFWSASFFIYIVCMITFTGTANTAIIVKIALYIFLGLSIINIIQSGKLKLNAFCVSLILYGTLLIFSWFYSPSQNIATEYLYNYWTLVVICIFVVNYIDSAEKANLLLDAYILGGLCLCLYAFSFYGTSIFNVVTQSIYGIRVGSEVGNTNDVGLSYAMSAIIAMFSLIYLHTRLTKRLYYIILIPICTIFALLSGSKKVFILLFIAIVLLFLLKKIIHNSLLKKAGLIILGGFLIYLLIYIIQNVPQFRTINERLQDMLNLVFLGSGTETDLTRKYFIQKGFEVFSDHPLFGAGGFSSYSYFGTYSHNNYIEILMNTGMIGFVLFYFPYLIFFFQLRKINSLNYPFKIFAIVFIITHLILGTALIYYYDRYIQIMFAGISAFLSYESKNANNLTGKMQNK